MSRIYVEFNRLEELFDDLVEVSSSLVKIKNSFDMNIKKLDWDIRAEQDINKNAVKIGLRLLEYKTALDRYIKFAQEALDKYKELESEEVAIYDKEKRVHDIFDGSNGYGGDQGDMKKTRNGFKFMWWVWGEDKDIYNFVRSRQGYENYSEAQIHELIKDINNEGCGYVALVNTMFSEFPGDEREFEKIFGFPMYDKDGNYNYNLMLLDIYCSTDDKFFLDEANGKMAYINEILKQQYMDKSTGTIDMTRLASDYGFSENATVDEIYEAIFVNAGGEVVDIPSSGTNAYTLGNRLSAYLTKKGIDADITCNTYNSMTTNNVENSIESGNMVDILLTNGAKIYDVNGKQVGVIGEGNHHVVVTGVTEDGKYKVSSWGKEYIVDSDSNIDYYVILDMKYK